MPARGRQAGAQQSAFPLRHEVLCQKVHPKGHSFTDKSGTWGGSGTWVVEVIALPDPEDLP